MPAPHEILIRIVIEPPQTSAKGGRPRKSTPVLHLPERPMRKRHITRRKWTLEEWKHFATNYGVIPTKRLSKQLHRSNSALHTLAFKMKKLGWKKGEDIMKYITHESEVAHGNE